MKYWLSVAILGLGTYLLRYSFIGGRFKFEMPPLVRQAMNYVPVSVMATLVALGFFADEQNNFYLYWPSLTSMCAAGFVAFKYRQDFLTIIIGLAVYWITEILLD